MNNRLGANSSGTAKLPLLSELEPEISRGGIEIVGDVGIALHRCPSLVHLIETTDFSWVDSRIIAALRESNLASESGIKRVHIARLCKDMSTSSVLHALYASGFEPCGIQVLLQFGRVPSCYASVRRIVELRESWSDISGNRWVVALDSFGHMPILTCISHGNDWVAGSIILSVAC